LRAVAFFAAAMFTQQLDNVMPPPDVHLLGTPNRTAQPWRLPRTRHLDYSNS
jgi:hypothetical protein